MRFHVVYRYGGFIFLLNAAALLISAIVSLAYSGEVFYTLLYSALIAALFGVFPFIFVPKVRQITTHEGLVIVVIGWLLSCLLGMLPYMLWGAEFTFTNAWFESVSGFTTTGSTILTDIEALPKGLLFWRSMTHWLGGMGIVVFVLSIMPFMGESAKVLYESEISPLATTSFNQRASHAVQILLRVYVGLTALETIALMICGMDIFDAVTHAFATIATGGFSPRNASIAHYNSLSIELVVMVFMILSGIHFALLFSARFGNFRALWNSAIVRYYLLALLVGTSIGTWNLYSNQIHNFWSSLRYATFQLVSVGTSTGFATADSAIWPSLSQLLLIFFSLQCACAGSTSGGIKVDRIVMLGKAFMGQIQRLRNPHSVISIRLGQQVIAKEIAENSVLYVAIYLCVILLSTALLIAVGTDSLEAFSGTVATMGNVGPGLGKVGSVGNFNHISVAGKWIYTVTMLLGRLEIYALILCFTPKRW